MNILKTLLIGALALVSATVFAAVDVNKATQAELESIKGIGPAVSTRIIDARKAGAFKDWNDLSTRVKGVKERTATKFSSQGLTVNGAAYTATAPAAASDNKPAKSQKATKTGAAADSGKKLAAQ